MSPDRKLVLVVARDDEPRAWLARTLVSRGFSVVLCQGPPPCPLARGEGCALAEGADACVIAAPPAPARSVAIGLCLCAARARRLILMERLRQEPGDGLHRIADAVGRSLDTT